jgi:alkylated DNA repair dioxygenase AlkB
VQYQPSLFGGDSTPSFDEKFSRLQRRTLDAESWVDHAPGWVSGSDALFEEVRASRTWGQRTRVVFENEVIEPRLTDHWSLSSGEPLRPEILERMRLALGAHYGLEFDSAGFNYYRDGRDSVAMHGDKIHRSIREPIVVLVSLGEPRRMLLKPREGGSSLPFELGRGDLFVTGGRTQRTWLHGIPKVAHAGPRISIAFRYGLDYAGYLRRARSG